MDSKKIIKYLKIVVLLIIVGLFVWFLVLSPLLTFKNYEKQIENAAKRYFEINERELPTGTRIKTLKVQDLFNKSYLKEMFYVPFSKEPCSIVDSWVKVRKQDNEYKYYTYLKCGVISSRVDHEGPEIMLNGKEEITIDKGSKYDELGVKSVIDNSDGKLDVKDVKIDSSDVNINKNGTYEVTYSIMDSLNNLTKKVRKVNVVSKLEKTILSATNNKGVYVGANPNNYIYFSGMLFRVLDIDEHNVRIVSDQDISNVNYSAIDEWLKYYYDQINKESKKIIVKNEYCNMKTSDDLISNISNCDSYDKNQLVSILSASDINKANQPDGNYLLPQSISWVRNEKNDKEAFTTRSFFFGSVMNYMAFDKNYNFGVRPVLTIKGDSLVVSGDGSKNNPYYLGDLKEARAGDKLNTRTAGEYISYSGIEWRIIDSLSDGVVKAIATSTLSSNGLDIVTSYGTDAQTIYNPKKNGNVGYFINNNAKQYINTKYLVNHEIEVPIYKKYIKYKEEIDTIKYKVKLAAPNMYEMFSAFDFNSSKLRSYWLMNSSKADYTKAVVADIGTALYGEVYSDSYGIRPVVFFDKECSIVRGDGTMNDPYVISK